MTKLEELEHRRAERRAEMEAARQTQLVKDLEALCELEDTHGDLLVRIDTDRYAPGLPTMAVFRMPNGAEIKRYQDRIRGRNGKPGDGLTAAIELSEVCQKGMYPDHETYGKLCEVFGNLPVNAGNELVKASQGVAAAEGKE